MDTKGLSKGAAKAINTMKKHKESDLLTFSRKTGRLLYKGCGIERLS